eukprot:TRINITY_DN1758_c0_g1_i1.p1 TRINITY_DN1758_c0_g1~~TRINITY_DN1758_c0_g1_i1.p1  ORF type:complete len:1586 (-),score=427.50 TRINITY_DN1758_c0_g1_i1:119-4876(-)
MEELSISSYRTGLFQLVPNRPISHHHLHPNTSSSCAPSSSSPMTTVSTTLQPLVLEAQFSVCCVELAGKDGAAAAELGSARVLWDSEKKEEIKEHVQKFKQANESAPLAVEWLLLNLCLSEFAHELEDIVNCGDPVWVELEEGEKERKGRPNVNHVLLIAPIVGRTGERKCGLFSATSFETNPLLRCHGTPNRRWMHVMIPSWSSLEHADRRISDVPMKMAGGMECIVCVDIINNDDEHRDHCDAVISDANYQAELFFNTSKEKLVGRSFYEFFPNEDEKAILEHVISENGAENMTPSARTHRICAKFSFGTPTRKKGVQKWMIVLQRPSLMSVTHGAMAIDRLQFRSKLLIEIMAHSVFLVKPSGMIVNVNEHVLQSYRVEREWVNGRNISDFGFIDFPCKWSTIVQNVSFSTNDEIVTHSQPDNRKNLLLAFGTRQTDDIVIVRFAQTDQLDIVRLFANESWEEQMSHMNRINFPLIMVERETDRIVGTSKSLQEMIGYTDEESFHLKRLDVISPCMTDDEEDDARMAQSNMQVIMSIFIPDSFDVELLCKNGGKLYMRACSVNDQERKHDFISIICTSKDFTISHLLHENEDFVWSPCLENVPIGIFVADMKCNFIECNAYASMMMGYGRSELLRMNVRDTFDGLKCQQSCHQAFEGDSRQIRTKMMTRCGNYLDVMLHIFRFSGPVWTIFCIDISKEVASQRILREREIQLAIYFEKSPSAIFIVGDQNNIVDANPAATRMTQFSCEELIGKNFESFFESDFINYVSSLDESAQMGGSEYRVLNRPGEIVFAEVVRVPLEEDRHIVFVTDITCQEKLKTVEEESKSRLRKMFSLSVNAIFLVNQSKHISIANSRACDMFGHGKQLEGMMVYDILDKENEWNAMNDPEKPDNCHFFCRGKRADGSHFDVELRSKSFLFTGEKHILFSMQDVTVEKRDELMKERQVMALHHGEQIAQFGYFEKNFQSGEIYWSPGFMRILQLSDADKELGLIVPNVHPTDEDMVRKTFSGELSEKDLIDFKFKVCLKDGTSRFLHTMARYKFHQDGSDRIIVCIRGVIHDTTGQWETEMALKESERRERHIVNNADEGVVLIDSKMCCSNANATFCSMVNCEEDDIIGEKFMEMISEPMNEIIRQAVASENSITKKTDFGETNLQLREQKVLPVNISILPLSSNSFLCFIYDCRERKQMELQKAELELRLRQTQKLEAISRLAGGIAHDFNNLLTAIVGNIDLARIDLKPDHRVHDLLGDMRIAAERATDLTSRLLAFSRKQTIQPVNMNLRSFIKKDQDLFKKTVGVDITLCIDYPKKSCCIHADEGQMEQVLLILLMNACEAMPNGGDIHMSFSRVHRRPHNDIEEVGSEDKKWFVCLKVMDSGEGMDEETQTKIFEPFFTTKPGRLGSGLGLATVYGIMKQNGGFVEVSSKLGEGSEFRLYMPQVEHGEKIAERKSVKKEKTRLSGTETILFAEDDPIVQKIASISLKKYGYQVICADDGRHALNILEETKMHPDLLLTDVVMPNMNGAELAKALLHMQPDVKILFTSGYAEEIIARHGIVNANVNFIAKPYSPAALCRSVRKVLDGEKV